MKNYSFKFWLITSIIALIVGTSTEYFISHTNINNIETTAFSQKLELQRNELNIVLNDFAFKIKTNGLNKFLPEAFKKYSSELNNSGLCIVVYNKNKIVYWSDNSFIVNDWECNDDTLQPISFINNTWVLYDQKTIDSIKIVGFVIIKNEFPVENNYLKNKFNSKFEIESDFDISKIPQQSAFQITDNNGNFLFSLVPVHSQNINESHGWLPLFFYVLALLFLFNGTYKMFKHTKKHLNIILFSTFLSIFVLRLLMMYFNFPHLIYLSSLFNPGDYASSTVFPSLGDLLIDSVLFFIVAYLFYKYFNINNLIKKSNRIIFLVSGVLFNSVLSVVILMISKSLILDSTITFQIYNILDTNYNTLIAFLIFILLIISCSLFLYKIIGILYQWFSFNTLIISYIITELLLFVLLFIFVDNVELYSLLFNVLVFIVFITNSFYFKKINFYFIILIILITTSYLTVFTLHFEQIKSFNTRKVISVGLSTERDLIAETLLDDLQKKISSDLIITELAKKSPDKKYELLQYLRENYFYGFWTKYDIQTTICTSSDNLKISETGELYGCFEYFENIVKKRSVQIPNTNFYFVENNNGRIGYLGILELKNKTLDSITTRIFIELDSRLLNQVLGYPELLLDKKINDANLEKKYSYAKYRNGKLLTRNGIYDYRININSNNNSNNEFYLKTFDDYEHLYYKPDKNTIIVLRVLATNFYDIIITFSYLLVFLIMLYVVYLICKNTYNILHFNLNLNIRSRILISFISVLILSFFLIGTVTVYYIINKYEKKNYENISEKMQSIIIELNNKVSEQNVFAEQQKDFVTSLLIKFSNVFYSDINLYSKDGTLYATSRPEVFEKGFVGGLMNPEAFYNINYQSKSEIVLEEHIGNLKYLSAYVPYNNSDGKIIAYLNLPFFTQQNALTREISTFATTLINIYLILILMAMLITFFITNGLTRPIILLQRKLREIELGKKNEPIYYKRNDEIGMLVNDYNKMLVELSKSAELLARSERETAWREMAKQIAHEIKNPLTPMKLSVQYLLRSFNDKTPGWELLVEKMTKTLIEQIDTLSVIASEFSSFARLPSPTIERVNIVEKIKSITELYKQSKNVQIVFNNNNFNNIIVNVDKEQLIRVFTNLIKNAIQAIPAEKRGYVKIDTFVKNNKAIVKIEDNGTGISDDVKLKLFIPNFTTKTSGMGLGLAMVKNMVEGMGGNISYETQIGVGTTFIIELPCLV